MRWVVLAALAGVLLAHAWRLREPRRRTGLRLAGGTAAALLAFAVLSTAWSGYPWLTFERSVTLGLLLACVAPMALIVTRRTGFAPLLADAIVAGAAAVAVGGLILLAVSYHDAVQRPNAGTPTRYRGLGENPNTAAMLLAVALPLAVSRLVQDGAGRRQRLLAGACVLLLAGSVFMSSSRGAIGGVVLGVATVIALTAVSFRRRLAHVAIAAILVAIGLGAASLPKPLPLSAGQRNSANVGLSRGADPLSAGQRNSANVGLSRGADVSKPRPQDSQGFPKAGDKSTSVRDLTSITQSGRLWAWKGAFHTGNRKPVLGHGFGTEERVFVDLYYWFQGSRPENSFLGMYLMLGGAGVLLLVALLALIAVAAWRAVRRLPLDGASAGLAGAFVAGTILAVVQSYLYSVGNIATLSFWTVGAALLALAARSRTASADPPGDGA